MTATLDGRSRIVATALELMGRHGVAGTSMRQLASACGVNVATLYHYFPSKSDLVRALLAERRYSDRIATEAPVIDPAAPPADRLHGLVRYLWDEAMGEESVWRVLIGESIRGDEDVRAAIGDLLAELDAALLAWVAAAVPELADPAAAARLVQQLLFAQVVVELAVGGADPDSVARDLAGALLG